MKIGIDIGGSHIGVGLVENDQILKVLDRNLTREDRTNMEETLVNEIQKLVIQILIESNIKIEDIELIGIACPGTISNGVIVKAGNLGIKNFDILTKLKEKLNCKIQIRNDGKCAALAEKYYGSLKNYDDAVFLNLGTGIGGAAFMRGKLLEPKRYSGFEFGHMVINKNGRTCSCGKQGCFETYCSIKAFKTKVTNTLDIDSDMSGQYFREELLKKEENNEKVRADVEQFLDDLKVGVCNLIDIFEPEVICFGGSFSYYEGHPILEKLIEKINESKSTFNEGEKPKVVTATFKNDAGIIGATLN